MERVKEKEAETCSVRDAAKRLGIGYSTAYAAAARGDLPVLRMGRRLVVPIATLDKMLGVAPDVFGDRPADPLQAA